jgi:predicted MPP superfamily phosphohydrolase
MLIALLVVIPLYHLYLGFRLLPDLPLGGMGLALGIAYLVASALLMPLAMMSRQMPQPRAGRLAWAGFIAMGMFSSLLVMAILRDLALLAAAAVGLLLPFAPAERFADFVLGPFREWSAMAIPALALLMALVGLRNARRLAGVKHVDIAIAGLPRGLHGFTITQLSDVHVGATIRRNYLDAIVNAANSIGSDMIAVTGDLVDGSVEQLRSDVEPLGRLAARHGVFFVTGNHEYYSGAHAWIEELGRLGLRVLMNEHVVIQHAGSSLALAGVTDYNAHHFDPAHRSDPAAAIAGAPGSALKLLLAHQPRSAFAAAKAGFQFQISGHTHGGQFLPWPWFVRLQQPFTSGLHRLDDLLVYTSRGTGYWGPPQRLCAPSEITCLRLQPA